MGVTILNMVVYTGLPEKKRFEQGSQGSDRVFQVGIWRKWKQPEQRPSESSILGIFED